ncbi:UPF0496 protein-like protein, partial [Tanacetum coccineum]
MIVVKTLGGRVTNALRKVSIVIFVATFAAVLICSVVAAAMVVPPVAAALATASAIPLGSMGNPITNYVGPKLDVEVWKLKLPRDVYKIKGMSSASVDYLSNKDICTFLNKGFLLRENNV